MSLAVGLAMLALMAIHVVVQPERAWVLLSSCDLAAIATAVGLVAARPRWVATAFLFQLMIGLPALIVGLFTTYEANPTGIAIHVVPAAIGAVIVARDGLPARAALVAWLGFAVSMIAAMAIGPPELNINFANQVWPPLEHVFGWPPLFQVLLLVLAAGFLSTGAYVLRRVTPRR